MDNYYDYPNDFWSVRPPYYVPVPYPVPVSPYPYLPCYWRGGYRNYYCNPYNYPRHYR